MTGSLNTYDSLIKRIKAYRGRVKKILMLKGLFIFLAFALCLVFLLGMAETIIHISTTGRVILDVIAIVFLLFVFAVFLGRPLIDFLLRPNTPSVIDTALDIGSRFDGVNDRLANGIQVYEKQKGTPERYSRELIEASFEKATESLLNEDFRQKAETKDAVRLGKRLLFLTTLIVIFWMIFSAQFLEASKRLLHPTRDFGITPTVLIRVSPGDTTVLKEDDLPISAVVTGVSGSEVSLHIHRMGLAEDEVRVFKPTIGDTFEYIIPAIKDSINYFVQVEGVASPMYTISVIELPMLRSLQAKISPPKYSGITPFFLEENIGDIVALKGSKITLTGGVNKSLQTAKLIFNNSRTADLNVLGKEIKGSFRLEREGEYHFDLIDQAGYKNSNPIDYRLTIVPDAQPVVRIITPGKDVDIAEDMLLPLMIEADDDYGFSSLRLGYQVYQQGAATQDSSEASFQTLKDRVTNDQQIRLQYTWDLKDLGLLPEDFVEYFAEVYDNDTVGGPKSARSRRYRIRFPSIYEMYEEMAQTQEFASESLEEVYERSRELKERLDNLAQEMKKDADLSWEERKELEEVVKNQQNLRKQVEDVSKRLEEMLDEMERNDLAALKTLEKYRELQELFEQIMTPELKEAMQEVAKAMEQLDPQKLKNAVEKLNFSQEDFLKSVERTIEMLKRLQVEQLLDEAVRKAENLHSRQKNLDQEAAQREKGTEGLSESQEKIKQNSEQLSELLKDLQRKMSEFPEMPSESVMEAQSVFDSTNLTEKMENMKQMLSEGQRASAQQLGKSLENSLAQISQSLQNAQNQMATGMKKEILQALRRSAHDLLQLSKKQEQLMNNTRGLNRNSPQLSELAEHQQETLSGLSRVMEQMYDLSKKTFFVTPQIGMSMGQAASNMGQAIENLEKRNSNRSADFQGQAMASLNSAIGKIQESMNQCQGASCSSMGLGQFMQRLKQMAGSQQGINQETMGLGMGGQFSLEQQAAMARLAAEQDALRKSLEDLLREAGGRSRILGRLDQSVKEMEEVVKDFNSSHIDQRTIDRQRRIHSRLLDAQKSVRERDYSRKREAETGKQYFAIDPQTLPKDLGQSPNRIHEDLLRAKKEGYSTDYLELIREYYEALSKTEIQK